MAYEQYEEIPFLARTLELIEKMNTIIAEHAADGFRLTVRQLYYQLVARDIIRNDQKEYKRIVDICANARLAGRLDWDAIEDRTRNLEWLPHWEKPEDVIQSAVNSFRVDKWSNEWGQRVRPEVWVEKEALANVVEHAATPLDVPWFCCRGYTSLSELRSAALRAQDWIAQGQTPFIIHLGDHDPSGRDMTRNLIARFQLFTGEPVEVKRIALNMPQINKYKPPPNPAKQTDSRYGRYVNEVRTTDCWELDAIKPRVLSALITKTIESVRDDKAWAAAVAHEEHERLTLQKAATKWEAVAKFVNKPPRKPRARRKPAAKKATRKRAAKKGTKR